MTWKLDAVLCPNDGLAGGAAAAVQELGLKKIMLSLLVWMQNWRRLKDLLQERRMQQCIWTWKNMASAAVDQAVALAKGEKVTANSEIANEKGEKIKAYLITGEMVTKENIDKILIESGYYTKEQVYGNN